METSLTNFLLQARTKTYAGNDGKVTSFVPGTEQFEFSEGELLYRDIYNVGNGIFAGLEMIYSGDKPLWTMSYYGNFKKMPEDEMDRILRKALIETWETTRIWKKVTWKSEEFEYVCDGAGSMEELNGTETITKDGEQIYYFYYAGGKLNE